MTKIKFRAWNESAKKYSKPFTLRCSVINFTDDDGLGVIKSLTDEAVEQFTGLKDKNGVEIYEGDIVSFNNNRSNKTYIDVIKWAPFDKLAGFQVESPMIDIFDATIKVIGNIHENPELLCAKK